ncbi:hypothetical protein [Streptomyces sp. 039-1]|uniref:hypothetical protein n=1 Tax=Streptomyces sp. 039-1 TaxID=2789263 RepID=UPI0039F544D4
MAVKSSVYAIFGVVIAPSQDLRALRAAMECQPADPPVAGAKVARASLFHVGDSEHIILGTVCEELEPNTYRPVPGPAVSPSWTGMLLSLTEQYGLAVSAGPSWLLVHDLS